MKLAPLLVLLLALAAPAGAAEPPQALKSQNVEWLGEIPSADGVSATFVGSHMFLSTFHGLDVYDVSDAAQPVKVGALPLPIFQNEDVETNGEILLMSRDASLGLSRLYVIDIRDPANPTLLSTLDTTDFGQPYAATGHTATCIADCRYAWLAGSGDGVDVVDLTDPSRPRFASPRKVRTRAAACMFDGRQAPCWGVHDVQVDEAGLAWAAGAGGTAAYDVSDPTRPELRFKTNRRGVSRALLEDEPDGTSYNDFIHHNSLRRGRTVFITEEDIRAGCEHPGSFQAWRIRGNGKLRPLDKWEVERDPARSTYCSAHYFDERDDLVVQGWYEAGARFIDVSKPGKLRQSAYWIPHRGNVASAYWVPTDPAGEIAYTLDEQRGVDILRIDRSAAPVRGRPPRQERGSGIAALPDLAAAIISTRERVRPGSTIGYRVAASNTRRRRSTPSGRALVELGRGLSLASGGREKVFRVPKLRPGHAWGRKIKVRVARGAPRLVEAAITLMPTDGDPANDYAVTRDPTRRGGRGARASAARGPLFCMLRR